MWLLQAVLWAVAGVGITAIALAVSPEGSVSSRSRAILLGLVGGVAGGLVVQVLARRQGFGFTAGVLGSLVTAMAVLLIWTVVAPEPRRRHA